MTTFTLHCIIAVCVASVAVWEGVLEQLPAIVSMATTLRKCAIIVTSASAIIFMIQLAHFNGGTTPCCLSANTLSYM